MRLVLLTIAVAAALVAAIVFVAVPEIDLFVSGLFYRGSHDFAFGEQGLPEAIRLLLDLMFWTVCAAAIAGVLRFAIWRRPLFGQSIAIWAFLVLLLAVGPGLVANSLLKENWGRARPDEIVQFGGQKTFSLPLIPSGQCTRNCSFVAGEVSSVFAAVLGLAMLAQRRRRMMFASALGIGAVAAVIRIGQGGHFLSDTLFAMIFMAFVAVASHWLVFGPASEGVRTRLRRNAPLPAPSVQ